MSGRPTKPSALKAIEGNRGKRVTNKSEPDPIYLNDLTPPDWLPSEAQVIWNELAPKLRRNRLLTEVDVEYLSMGCIAIAQYRESVKRIGEQLVRGNSEQKGDYINPWLLVQSMNFKQAKTVLTDFGCSPAARTRVIAQPQLDLFGNGPAEKDKSSRFFKD